MGVSSSGNDFAAAIRFFLRNLPAQLSFPIGGEFAIPLAAESELVVKLDALAPWSRNDVELVRREITRVQAYDLFIFSIRMAVHAARTDALLVIRTALVGTVIDNDLVDWRDVLVGLSIIEDCAFRLGTDLRGALSDVLELGTDRQRALVADYLARPPELRGMKSLGVAATGAGDTLAYELIPWR